MWLDAIREHALAFPGAREEFPFGPDPVFKNSNGKIFLFVGSVEHDGSVRVSVKLTPPEAEEALLLPFVAVAPYVGRYGWVSVQVTGPFELETALAWTDRSCELAGSKPRRR